MSKLSFPLRLSFGIFLLLSSVLTLLSATLLFSEYSDIDDTNFVLLSEITNGAHHMHPWLATTLSILFLGFIVFIIILCGDKAG
jgi:hypothetical protein